MPKKIQVELAERTGEKLVVEAELTATDGLVVHRVNGDPKSKIWAVTHAPSGYMVTWARTKREAREIAFELGFRLLGGWNRPIDHKNKDEVNAALKALQGALSVLYPEGRV